jgi:hypothetical protein
MCPGKENIIEKLEKLWEELNLADGTYNHK